jgi:hypothetical protein
MIAIMMISIIRVNQKNGVLDRPAAWAMTFELGEQSRIIRFSSHRRVRASSGRPSFRSSDKSFTSEFPFAI